jgi:hypothetical protein
MAEDNWHHLEGAYPRARLFRAFFYNDFTQPIPAKGFSGRVAVLDSADKEVASFPLRAGGVRTALDARIASPKFPLKLKMWVKFAPTDKEHTFDFSFASLTKEPVAPLVTNMTDDTATGAAPTGLTTSAKISAGPPAAAFPGSPQSASQLRTIAQPPGAVQPVPGAQAAPQGTASELVAELVKKSEEVQSLLNQGNLGALWFQAIAAKDLALALEEHQSALSDRQRLTASMRQRHDHARDADCNGSGGDLLPDSRPSHRDSRDGQQGGHQRYVQRHVLIYVSPSRPRGVKSVTCGTSGDKGAPNTTTWSKVYPGCH